MRACPDVRLVFYLAVRVAYFVSQRRFIFVLTAFVCTPKIQSYIDGCLDLGRQY